MTINEKSLVVAKSAITKLFLLNPIGDTLTKGMPLSINKNKNLMIVKNLSSYSVRLNDATKSVASSSEMEAIE